MWKERGPAGYCDAWILWTSRLTYDCYFYCHLKLIPTLVLSSLGVFSSEKKLQCCTVRTDATTGFVTTESITPSIANTAPSVATD
jgi:hypothetical protein